MNHVKFLALKEGVLGMDESVYLPWHLDSFGALTE